MGVTIREYLVSEAVADQLISPTTSGLRRPPQVTLVLDAEQHVLHVNRDLAGTGFAGLAEEPGATLHSLIHPDCEGKCRFSTLLQKAWASLLSKRQSIEWEVEDPVWGRHLRLSLARPPTSKDVPVDRRRHFASLTVTDITEIRREYDSVLALNQDLQRRIRQLETGAAAANADTFAADLSGQYNTRVLAAQERERQRIGADIHDGVAQTLGVVKFGIEARIAELRREHPDIDLSDFDLLVSQVREAIEDLRKISRNLSPPALSEFGICKAIQLLCDEFGTEIPNIEVNCATCANEVGLPEAIKVALYRIVQEALNNIGKHARAQRVRVALAHTDSGLELEITDDGVGFEQEGVSVSRKQGKGLGLDSMQERVALTGGSFEIRSAVGDGTALRAVWPESAIVLLRDQPVLDSE
jgi:signal transduction histidine kinase